MRLKNLHYGWVVVAIGVSIQAVRASTIYTFGIFLIPLTMEFNWDRGALTGAYSLSMLIGAGLAILSGRLSDKYGPRILLTLSGLLTGIGFLLMSQINSLWQVYLIWVTFMAAGFSCGSVPVLSTIPRWFTKKRGLALGITATGFSLGAMIWAPLTQWIISSYGWQQAYVVLGLITLITIIPLAQFMKHSPQRVGLKPYGEDSTIEDKQSLASTSGGLSFKQAIKTRHFWVLASLLLCFLFALEVITVHIVPHAVDIGISAMVAASIVSIIAAASIIGKLFMGFISDKVGGRPALAACLGMLTLALIVLLFAREVWMFYIFAVVFGFAYGGVLPLQTLIPAELFGLKFLGMILGVIMVFNGIGGALGAPLAGYIFDVTGSYRLAFLISVVIGALAIILSLILLKAKEWRGALDKSKSAT